MPRFRHIIAKQVNVVRLKLATLQKVFGNGSKVIVEDESRNLHIILNDNSYGPTKLGLFVKIFVMLSIAESSKIVKFFSGSQYL